MLTSTGKGMMVWGGVFALILTSIMAAATSPLMAWRDPIYIAASFAGIIAMGLLLVQPLLAKAALTGLNARRSRQLHQIVGSSLVICVTLHVVGLWITSPPDVIDALTFRSPTPFAAWGVIAMWALFLSFIFMALRRRLRLSTWSLRRVHLGFSVIIVSGTIVHAVLIQGTMEPTSKHILSGLILAVTLWAAATNIRRQGK